jgi:hypothetical protein
MPRTLLTAGALVFALVVALVLGSSFGPPPAGCAAAGGFQLPAFVIDGKTPGAYVVDVQTGDVFQVVGKDAPVHLGSVTAARPKR